MSFGITLTKKLPENFSSVVTVFYNNMGFNLLSTFLIIQNGHLNLSIFNVAILYTFYFKIAINL